MHPIVTILFRPRATMRRILASDRTRGVIPIVLLAICSSMISEFQKRKLPPQAASFPGPIWIVVVLATIAAVLILLLLFYGLSWAAVGAGRVLEGKGNARDVRAALAWGTVPIIWAILYRLPAAIFVREPSALRVDASWLVLIALLIAEIAVFIWWVITTSHTLAVAHHFSAPRGFMTLVLTMMVPIVLLVAGVLTATLRS